MGFADNTQVKDILASAKICPNLSEPHAQEFGFDVNERCFKLLSNKCFCISDNVASLKKSLTATVLFFLKNQKNSKGWWIITSRIQKKETLIYRRGTPM